MGFFDSLLKNKVNSVVRDSYRDNYFKRNPGRYHRCNGCGRTLDMEVQREVTIDHIVPQKYGGTNAITNLQVLCQPCNSKKGAKVNMLTAKYSGEALVREIRNIFR